MMTEGKIKVGKKYDLAHTSPSQYGSGDFNGMGVRQKVGTMKRDYLQSETRSKNLGKPPKSLA